MTAPSIKEAYPVCCYCDATLACEKCGREQPALATLSPPAGERREAIALKLFCHSNNPVLWSNPNAILARDDAYALADIVLASGLVQDEAAIRADEREKCAKNCDQIRNNAERRAGIHENGEARNAALDKMEGAIQCAAAIRSTRDGGAET